MDITVCTTATLRPTLLIATYQSFWDKCFKQASQEGFVFHLSINVDPVGEDVTKASVLEKALTFPWASASCRAPETASFPAAFLNAFGSVWTKYLIGLEEDWLLLAPVDLGEIISWFEADPKLAIIRLPAFKSDAENMKNWGIPLPWNGRYFECPQDQRAAIGFCGHPSIIRTAFMEQTLPLLDPRRNPEKQYHYRDALIDKVNEWNFGVYGRPHHGPYIQDIGREWMVANGWQKAGDKYFFTNWQRRQ